MTLSGRKRNSIKYHIVSLLLVTAVVAGVFALMQIIGFALQIYQFAPYFSGVIASSKSGVFFKFTIILAISSCPFVLLRRYNPIRSQLLLMFAVWAGIGLICYGPSIWRANRQRAAVAMIYANGGDIERVIESGGPEIRGVRFSDAKKITDQDMKTFTSNCFSQLKELDLRQASITDAGLAHLAGLTQLQTLFLFDTQVTDAGLKELARLTQLHTLSLGGTKVTDGGLKELAGLPQLSSLYVYNTKVTYEGVKGFHEIRQPLPNCEIRH